MRMGTEKCWRGRGLITFQIRDDETRGTMFYLSPEAGPGLATAACISGQFAHAHSARKGCGLRRRRPDEDVVGWRVVIRGPGDAGRAG